MFSNKETETNSFQLIPSCYVINTPSQKIVHCRHILVMNFCISRKPVNSLQRNFIQFILSTYKKHYGSLIYGSTKKGDFVNF